MSDNDTGELSKKGNSSVSRRRRYVWFYDHVHSRYYQLAMKWCFLPLGGERKVRQELLRGVDFHPCDRILDMCCGTGNTTFVLAEMVGGQAAIKGIDLSRGMIDRAKKWNRFPNVEFMTMDAERTSFEAASFDKVIIPHALHEMFHQSRRQVLQEAGRLLVNGGRLVVLELDIPPRFLDRLLMGFWLLYWLPFNFETPTRRDMFRHDLVGEIRTAGFRNIVKRSLHRGMLQTIQGER